MNDGKTILYRTDAMGRVMYVSEVPGDGGVDWGYVGNVDKAKPMSPYWRRRFFCDMRRVGVEAKAVHL